MISNSILGTNSTASMKRNETSVAHMKLAICTVNICNTSGKFVTKRIYDQLVLRMYVQSTALNKWASGFGIEDND